MSIPTQHSGMLELAGWLAGTLPPPLHYTHHYLFSLSLSLSHIIYGLRYLISTIHLPPYTSLTSLPHHHLFIHSFIHCHTQQLFSVSVNRHGISISSLPLFVPLSLVSPPSHHIILLFQGTFPPSCSFAAKKTKQYGRNHEHENHVSIFMLTNMH